MKKYIILALALGVFTLGAQAAEAETGLFKPAEQGSAMRAYAVDVQSANLGATQTQTKKTKKPTKKSAKKKTAKKPAKKTTKKTAKKSSKKTAKKDISTTAQEIEGANIDGTDITDTEVKSDIPADQTTEPDKAGTAQNKADDPPLASPEPQPRKLPAKGFAFAGLAGSSGLGLVYLIRKFFFH